MHSVGELVIQGDILSTWTMEVLTQYPNSRPNKTSSLSGQRSFTYFHCNWRGLSRRRSYGRFCPEREMAADIIHIVIQYDWSTRFLLWLVHTRPTYLSDQRPWHHHENVKRCQQPRSPQEPRSQETFLQPLPVQLLLILHQASPVRLLPKESGYLH